MINFTQEDVEAMASGQSLVGALPELEEKI